MGKADAITKEYIRNPEVFADAFNNYLYGGEQRIDPRRLREVDTTEITVPYGEDGTPIPVQKYRDVLKLLLSMTDGETAYCIMGIESQSDIHYAVPVKNGVYDFIQLARQIGDTARSHKKMSKSGRNRKVSSGEYLGGFWKTDRLVPVVTLVIYFGADEWDAPLTLREMYSCDDPAILEHAADYRVNLIAPHRMSDEEIVRFGSSLREVMLYIKHSGNKRELEKVVDENKDFRNIDKQAVDVINVVTGSEIKYVEGEKTMSMCLGMQQIRSESRLEGKLEGAIMAYQNIDMPIAEVIEQISKQFKLSKEEADKTIKKYWNT